MRRLHDRCDITHCVALVGDGAQTASARTADHARSQPEFTLAALNELRAATASLR